MEPQGTSNNRTNLNSDPAQTPASASSAPLHHISTTHAPAPQLSPFHTARLTGQGEESEGRGLASSHNSADDKLNQHNSADHKLDQHEAPLTEQLQSRSIKNHNELYLHPTKRSTQFTSSTMLLILSLTSSFSSIIFQLSLLTQIQKL